MLEFFFITYIDKQFLENYVWTIMWIQFKRKLGYIIEFDSKLALGQRSRTFWFMYAGLSPTIFSRTGV